MSCSDGPALVDLYRAAPFQFAMFTVVPAGLAIAQLFNSVFTDLPFAISVPFAITMLGCAGLITQLSFARFKRQRIDAMSTDNTV